MKKIQAFRKMYTKKFKPLYQSSWHKLASHSQVLQIFKSRKTLSVVVYFKPLFHVQTARGTREIDTRQKNTINVPGKNSMHVLARSKIQQNNISHINETITIIVSAIRNTNISYNNNYYWFNFHFYYYENYYYFLC